jgi:hypothetical protein
MEPSSLNVPQTVFSLFYAISWGLVANGQIRWKAFDWALATRGFRDASYRPSWERLKLSLCYLTALPIIVFIIIVSILASLTPRSEGAVFVFQLLVATIAAQSAFGPYRLWLGKVENDPMRFFYAAKSGRENEYASQPWQQDGFHYLDPQWSKRNWFAACGYILVGILIALVGSVLDACLGA